MAPENANRGTIAQDIVYISKIQLCVLLSNQFTSVSFSSCYSLLCKLCSLLLPNVAEVHVQTHTLCTWRGWSSQQHGAEAGD